MTSREKSTKPLMPAEWEAHDATWISWPKNPEDWPGKFQPIKWVYAEIVRLLSTQERVEILCHDDTVAAEARDCLTKHNAAPETYRLHIQPTDRSWLRDSAPTAVRTGTEIKWTQWAFNAWAKYDDYKLDRLVPPAVAKLSGLPLLAAVRPDKQGALVLEGGAIDTDGIGTLLATEECLLSDVQIRNPGLSKEDYEEAFRRYLGITKTIWLPAGIAGDDTHGHVDDVARFVAPATVVLAYEEDPAEENHRISVENWDLLKKVRDAKGRTLNVIKLPLPHVVQFAGQRLPASYANFYIANGLVLVPTFNDPNDRQALNKLAAVFPTRRVVGVHSTDLVLGLGTLHCLTQQQPAQFS